MRSRTNVIVAALFAVLSLTSNVHALGPLGHAPPPRSLPDADAGPDAEPDDFTRRTFEIDVAPTIAALGCAGSAPSTAATADPCAHLGPAPGLAIAFSYRLLPHFAIGGVGTYTDVPWDAARGFGLPARGASGAWFSAGLAGRAYLFVDGRFDPSVGFSIGAGSLALAATTASGSAELTRKGFSSTVDLALPFWLSARFRVGPDVAFTWQPGSSSESCSNGTCLDGSTIFARVPSTALRLGLVLTIGVGDEL